MLRYVMTWCEYFFSCRRLHSYASPYRSNVATASIGIAVFLFVSASVELEDER